MTASKLMPTEKASALPIRDWDFRRRRQTICFNQISLPVPSDTDNLPTIRLTASMCRRSILEPSLNSILADSSDCWSSKQKCQHLGVWLVIGGV